MGGMGRRGVRDEINELGRVMGFWVGIGMVMGYGVGGFLGGFGLWEKDWGDVYRSEGGVYGLGMGGGWGSWLVRGGGLGWKDWVGGEVDEEMGSLGTESRLRPYHFIYPERSLTMEEMLNKFIDEGKQEHEEIRAFIHDFQTTNKLLFKEMNNSLIELRFGVQELLKVINNVPMIDCDVKGVTTRGEKTTTQYVHDNNTNVLPKEPLAVELEKPVGSNEVLTNDQPQMTSEPIVQP
ncbi:hypothetical protein Tco_1272220 [Tanacetum coccineum]